MKAKRACRNLPIALAVVLLSTALVLVNTSPVRATGIWSTPIDLSEVGQNAGNPQVAMSADGTKATAVWSRSNGTNQIVQARSATIDGNTVTWGEVTTDLSAVGGNALAAQVVLSADGTKATAVWYRYVGFSDFIVQASSATISGNTATWGAVTDLSTVSQVANRPQVALSADGTKATAVWERLDGTFIVQARSATISGNTAAWGAVTTNLSAAGGNAFAAQVALSADGTKATAVWDRIVDGGNFIVQARSATISENIASWGADTTDLSDSNQSAQGAQVALSTDGTRATAVWSRVNGFKAIVQARSATISENTAAWGAVTTNLSADDRDAFAAQVALSTDGTKATAVWERSDDIVQARSATISGNTATWGAITTDLSAASPVVAFGAQVALSANGTKATAVWNRYVGTGTDFIVQARSATIIGNIATWGDVTDLSAVDRDAFGAQVALSANGTKATAVWFRSNGTNQIVQSAQLLDEPDCDLDGSRTLGQGGWGDRSPSNPLTSDSFDVEFPLKIGGSDNSITFTTASAMRNFLPQSGTPAVLNGGNVFDRSRSLKNTFAGQTAALTLNLALSPNLATATLADSYNGYTGTLADLLDDANEALNGTGSPSKSQLSALNRLLDYVNSAFGGGVDSGRLVCGTSPE
jgi:hypothetical protein